MTLTTSRALAMAALLAATGLTIAPSAHAQEAYSTRAVEMIVPFAPGGSTGLTARAVAQALEERWKVSVRVVNKPGGNTVPAVEEVLRAKPDGYTVLAESPASSSMLEVVVRNLPFKAMDRTFMGMIAQTPMIFIVAADSPFKTMQDAIAAAKKDPASFSWTSLGGAGAQDYTFRQLFRSLGIEVRGTRAVASKGGAEAVTMTAGGNVMLGAGSWSAVGPLLQSGKLRALAVAAPTRFPTIPDVPTMAELGHKDVEILFWFSVSGPAGLPDHVVKAWDEALTAVAANPAFVETLSKIGMVPYVYDAVRVRQMVEGEKKVVETLWAR